MNQASLPLLALVVALAVPVAAQAETAPPPEADAVTLDPYANVRYRLELVDQAGLPEDAAASTVRVKAGVNTGEWQGFSVQVEGEAIVRIGPRDYNDTVNGQTGFPVVADPSDVLLNQALLRWKPVTEFTATAGRQAVNLDNQRWIGSVGWRQNDQTLDAVRLTLVPAKGAEIDYFHAWRVDRVFGPDSPQGIWRGTDIHGVRAAYTIPGVGTLSGFGYWLDIPSAPASSSRTLGVRIAGERTVGSSTKLLYVGEYARQTDYGVNPRAFALDYLAGEAGLARGGWTAKIGFERLEGDGIVGLQTPLATLHAFNGWADKFLLTPADGLRDLYLDLAYRFGDGSALKGLALRAVWHDFNAPRTGLDYGQEWDLLASYPVTKKVTLLAKAAHYDANGFASDTTKAWLSLEMVF